MVDWPHGVWGDRVFLLELLLRGIMGKLFGWLKANKGKVGLVVGTVGGLLAKEVPGVAGVLEALAKALGN